MLVGVPRETFPGERRVALVPAVIPNLKKAGLEVVVEAGAGVEAGYPDAEYVAKGAKIAPDRAEVFAKADIIVQVLCYGSNDRTGKADLPLLRRGQVLIGFLRPLGDVGRVQDIAATGVTSFSVELMPRTTRAQSMDALSSMATICGYKAVLIAADTLPRMFPMLTTAAGTITPARVLVIGAGVAGLQAIATARRLGAVVFGLRFAPRRQGAGAEPGRALRRAAHRGQRRAGRPRLRQGAGRGVLPAPARVARASRGRERRGDHRGRDSRQEIAGPGHRRNGRRRMAPGSVIVDLAAERGGNCELTRAGEIVVEHGVTIIGSHQPCQHRSLSCQPDVRQERDRVSAPPGEGRQAQLNLDDEIMRETLVTQGGEVVNPRVREFFSLPALVAQS